MAGHSQFKNIMHRKGAQDAKRAKVFTKLIRELTVAARAGLPDPEKNPRLRAAVTAAHAANMPKDTMERAIKRGGGEAENSAYQEVRYEGYGPGGVAMIVETLTDNRNRTAGALRTAFAKHGGNLGEVGSVAFQFSRLGVIRYPQAAADANAMLEAAAEAGALDCESDEHGHELTTEVDAFYQVRTALESDFGPPESAGLAWRAAASIALDEDRAETLLKLLDVLDDNDDVQEVVANFEVADDVLAKLTA
jgi:YebC/PmpR family DNA-binding regulatory protein